MDDTGEHIETPICRGVNAGKRFRDEGRLTRVPSEYIFELLTAMSRLINTIINNGLFLYKSVLLVMK